MRKKLETAKKRLKDKKLRADWQKDCRQKQKERLRNLQRNLPETDNVPQISVGRPRLESNQSGLLQAICDIAMHSGSADDRRRSEKIRACRTLDSLHEELQLM